MAVKRKTKKKTGISAFKKNLSFAVMLFVAPLMGVAVFNLDRPGHLSEQKYVLKQFLPGWAKRFLPESNAAAATLPPGAEIEARVVEVYDGDTITVLSLDNKTKYRLRLFGIDAPETTQPYGDESRLMLHRLIYGRQIAIQVVDNDTYGRAIAKIYYDNTYINLAMVTNGCAWYYRTYAPRELDLPLAENQAKLRQVGLWQSSGPTPPWEFRKANK